MNLGDLPFPKGGDFAYGPDYTRLWRGKPLMLSDTVAWTAAEERECIEAGLAVSDADREYKHRLDWLGYRARAVTRRKKLPEDPDAYENTIYRIYACEDLTPKGENP